MNNALVSFLRLAAAAAAAFVALCAHAADTGTPGAGVTEVPTASWPGFYFGVNGGYGGGANSGALNTGAVEYSPSTLSSVSPASGWSKLTPEGGFGGGQLGYNVQRNRFVSGVETDIQSASLKGNAFSDAAFPTASAPDVEAEAWTKSRLDWFGTVRGRLGYSFGNTLLYVTGGFAYGGVRDRLTTEVTPAMSHLFLQVRARMPF